MAVDLAVTVALALGCAVSARSCFARKHYFYPDLPKGYQITQHDRPIATGGALSWRAAGRHHTVRLVRVHLEEDAGKSLHEGFPDSAESAYLDFNRSGVPLVEIVTEPDIGSAADAAEFARRLRATLVAIGASDANMEEGGLRCDANVSLRRRGRRGLGVRTEYQEPQFLPRAPARPRVRNRQARARARRRRPRHDRNTALGRGGRAHRRHADQGGFGGLPVLSRTGSRRRWRSRAERLARLRAALPELPEACEARLTSAYGLGDDDAAALARAPGLASYFERTAQASGDAAAACLWVRGELTRRLAEAGLTIEGSRVTPEALGDLIRMAASGAMSASAAKQILARMMATGDDAAAIAAADGLLQESGSEALEALVDATLAKLPAQVAQYRAGSAPWPGSSWAR